LVYELERRLPDTLEALRFGLSHRYAVKDKVTFEVNTAIDAVTKRAAVAPGARKMNWSIWRPRPPVTPFGNS
jgi:hypothetical protein